MTAAFPHGAVEHLVLFDDRTLSVGAKRQKLADSATGPDRTYQSMVTTLAVETRAANNRATIQEQIADTAVRDADSVGAVSIDEEMAMMISAQRAFEANARVMTVVDEMLGFLIERTGTVGR